MDISKPGTSQSFANIYGPPIFDLYENEDGGSSISAQPDLSQDQESEEENLDLLRLANEEENENVHSEIELDSDEEIELTADELQLAQLMATNETYEDLIDGFVAKVEKAIEQNRESQRDIKTRMAARREPGEASKSFFPIQMYMAPYFHDSDGMIPELNEEAKMIMNMTRVDLNFREPLPWKKEEEDLLKNAVKESILLNRLVDLDAKKQLIAAKLQAAGEDTTSEQILDWREKLSALNRKILYTKSRPDSEIFLEEEYPKVDWPKIANTDFKGTRTIQEVKQKFMYDLDPKWNRDYWTEEEDAKLRELATKPWVSWDVIADKLGTHRSPWNCFVRFKRMKTTDRQHRREWAPAEDDKLVNMVQAFKIGDYVPWAKVATFIPGRTKHSCEMRYTRSLDRGLKMGRWSEEEDLMLINAVNKYGPRDWERIAELVPKRSSMQCRNRWVDHLDYKRNTSSWSFEEDERLLLGLKIFGRGNFSDIAKFIPGRNSHDIRMRIRFFTNFKIKISQLQEDDGTVYLKNKTKLHDYFKERKEMVHNKFKEIVERSYQDPDLDHEAMEMAQRIGIGNFVLTPDGQQSDYARVFEQNKQTYGKAITITRRGRWKPIKKTVNEYDETEIMKAINKLDNEKRDEALIFWDEVQDQDKAKAQINDPSQIAEEDFSPDRLARINELLDTVVTIEQSDLNYYNRSKNNPKPPKIEICRRKRNPKPKKSEVAVVDSSSIDPNLLDVGMEAKQDGENLSQRDPMYTLFDRNLSEFEENIKSIENPFFIPYGDRPLMELYDELDECPTPKEKRFFALKQMCIYLKELDNKSNLFNLKNNNMLQSAHQDSMNYVTKSFGGKMVEAHTRKLRVLDIGYLQNHSNSSKSTSSVHHPTTSTASRNDIEMDRETVSSLLGQYKKVYTKEALLKNILPPNPASVQGFCNYMEERHNFVSGANYLFDSVDDDLEAKTELNDAIHEKLDIRFSEEVKTSLQYQLLRKHIFSTFLFPALLLYSERRNKIRLNEMQKADELIAKRYETEKEWLMTSQLAKQAGETEPDCQFPLFEQEAKRVENPKALIRAPSPLMRVFDQMVESEEFRRPLTRKMGNALEKSIGSVMDSITENKFKEPLWVGENLPKKRSRRPKNPISEEFVPPKRPKNTHRIIKSPLNSPSPTPSIPPDMSIEQLQHDTRFNHLSIKDALKSQLVQKRPRSTYGLYDTLYKAAEKKTAFNGV